MEKLPNRKVKTILDNISDPRQKSLIEGILTEKVVSKVQCMSKKCRGRIVAHFVKNVNDNRETPEIVIKPTVNKKGVMFLLAYRPRLDGFAGFQCICGNDSRLSKAEMGVKGIENNAVTKKDLNEVFAKLTKKPATYTKVGGKLEIDNFVVTDI